jgi:hypothetical protein
MPFVAYIRAIAGVYRLRFTFLDRIQGWDFQIFKGFLMLQLATVSSNRGNEIFDSFLDNLGSCHRVFRVIGDTFPTRWKPCYFDSILFHLFHRYQTSPMNDNSKSKAVGQLRLGSGYALFVLIFMLTLFTEIPRNLYPRTVRRLGNLTSLMSVPRSPSLLSKYDRLL